MTTTLLILLLSAIFFVHGKIRSDIVALCSLLLLLATGILTPEEALAGFSNPVVIMMAGLFVVGGAIFKTGLAKMIGSRILNLAGESEIRLLVLIMLVTAFIGAFVSNTGTVALMMPIVISMAAKANINASRLLMPLAFASSMGMLTLISTPPNLIIQGVLQDAGYFDIGFFSFTPVALICIVIGILAMIPLSKIFLTKKDDAKKKKDSGKSSKDLAMKYQLLENLYRLQVKKNSSICNQKLIDLNVTEKYELNILEVRRQSSSASRFMKTVDQKLGGPNTELKENDILYIFGPFNKVEEFANNYSLEFTDAIISEYTGESSKEKLSVREIGIAEILLMPDSGLTGKAVKNTDFRKIYNVNILAIQRSSEYILRDIKNVRLHDGDIVLVQGNWEDIAHLTSDPTLVVLGQPLEEASKVTLDYKAPIAAGIMVLMIAAMVFDFIPIPPVGAVLIAAVLMILTGCFKNVEEAYKTINWESIVLFAAMLPMSSALSKTGVSDLISNSLVSGLGEYGPFILLAGIYFTTSLMTLFISNTVTAVLVAPIALQSALSIDASPYTFLMAVTIGASMCFASPFSTPPNALVMSAGKYTFLDYVKVGLPLQLGMGVIVVFILPLFFPF